MADPASPDRAPQPTVAGTPSAQTHGFLFADLRGYTSYADTRGDHAAAGLLERYRALVRDAVASAGGAEIKTEGDSFYVVFDSVSGAVRCGLAIVGAAGRTAGEADPIAVGVGIHAGETVETGEGFVGSPVNIAARLCAEAKAGELVVSDTVRSLTRTYLDVDFQPLGARRLKGLAEPVTLYRVVPRGAGQVRPEPVPAGGRRRIAILGAVALVVVATVAVLFAMSRPSAAPAASPAPSAAVVATATSSPTSVPSATTLPSPSATLDVFPNPAEQALLTSIGALPAIITNTCMRGPYTAVKSMYGEAVPRASLTCLPNVATGASSLLIRQFGPYRETQAATGFGIQGSLDASVIGRIAGGNPDTRSDDILPGDCATSPRAAGNWETALGAATGLIICYTDPPTLNAILWWTYTKPSILVTATNERGDSKALYAFFKRYADFIGP